MREKSKRIEGDFASKERGDGIGEPVALQIVFEFRIEQNRVGIDRGHLRIDDDGRQVQEHGQAAGEDDDVADAFMPPHRGQDRKKEEGQHG